MTKSKLNLRVTKDEQQQKVPQGVTDPTSKQQNAKQTSSPEKPACINNSLMVRKTKNKTGTTYFPRMSEMDGKNINSKVNSIQTNCQTQNNDPSLPNLLKRPPAVMFPAEKEN